MIISIIAAVAENNAIGKNNKLLWHLSDDLKFFKNYTLGKVIIMGRKTFESIGKRALPGRMNAIISKDDSIGTENIAVFRSLESALTHFKNAEEVCIVGGAQIYKESLPLAAKLVLTRVAVSPDADVFFPAVDWGLWKKISEEKHLADEKNDHNFTFEIFERKG